MELPKTKDPPLAIDMIAENEFFYYSQTEGDKSLLFQKMSWNSTTPPLTKSVSCLLFYDWDVGFSSMVIDGETSTMYGTASVLTYNLFISINVTDFAPNTKKYLANYSCNHTDAMVLYNGLIFISMECEQYHLVMYDTIEGK